VSIHKINQPEHLRDVLAETLAIHGDRHLNFSSSIAPPIYQTATFGASSAEEFSYQASSPRAEKFYTRYGNPTLDQAAAVVAALEGADSAMAVSSGMAAIATAVLTFVHQGAHLIAQRNHYGGTLALVQKLLPRLGVEVTQVDQSDITAFKQALRPNTKMILVESPSNPLMSLTNLRLIAEIARSQNILTMADNTFATPINQRPLALGIDLVVHSGTKYLGGHSDLLAGVICGPGPLLDKIWDLHLILGAVLSPFEGWLMLRGLRTLPVRVRQHNQNALALAGFLEHHPAVRIVHYPGLESHPQHQLAQQQMSGFGGVLSFALKGGFDAAEKVLASLKLVPRAASLGGVETLAVHPAAMFARYQTEEESAKIEIGPDLLRISVGIENERDLIADFDQALDQIGRR